MSFARVTLQSNAPQYQNMKKPERGLIRTVDKQMIKGKEYTPTKKIEVPFLFNPAELTVSMTNDWKTPESNKHSGSKPLEFTGSQPRSISMQLFFDTYELHDQKQWRGRAPDVREYTDKLAELMQIQKGLGPKEDNENSGWPPQVLIEWGNLKKGWKFPCYITSMTQKFLLFTPDGTPVRATVDLTLKVADPGPLGAQNPTSGGLGSERTRLVSPGERLDWIAYQEYGDSTLWRLIADANGLQGLRDLPVGQRLAIPPRR